MAYHEAALVRVDRVQMERFSPLLSQYPSWSLSSPLSTLRVAFNRKNLSDATEYLVDAGPAPLLSSQLYRIIYGDVGQTAPSLSDLSLVPENPPCVAETSAASISPSTSHLEIISPSARESGMARVMKWVSRAFSFASSSGVPQPTAAPNVRRGSKQSAIAAAPSSPCFSKPPTEFAITSSHGLRTFVHDPNGQFSSACRTASPVQADDADCSDSSSVYTNCSNGCSSVDSGSSTGSGRPAYHQPIDFDVDKFAVHLNEIQFYERAVLTQLSLKDQIAAYLERQPDGHLGSQVRVLVYAGHNGQESTRLTVTPEVTYPWSNLRRLLQKVPPRVVVVVVLACCHAAKPLEEFIQDSTIPEIIALAACDRDEISKADNFKGDRFLDALLELLQHGGPQGCFEDWEPFVEAVAKNMTKFGTRNQHPVAYIRTNQVSQQFRKIEYNILMRRHFVADAFRNSRRIDELPTRVWARSHFCSGPILVPTRLPLYLFSSIRRLSFDTTGLRVAEAPVSRSNFDTKGIT
ncbi:hypothetical protein FRC12_019619 [Ceratobasidium sp. 428]|nr:hypothetical protein FRC12_019619 [Ceratobasidium sp. 428]